jgi:hypothetical protein
MSHQILINHDRLIIQQALFLKQLIDEELNLFKKYGSETGFSTPQL